MNKDKPGRGPDDVNEDCLRPVKGPIDGVRLLELRPQMVPPKNKIPEPDYDNGHPADLHYRRYIRQRDRGRDWVKATDLADFLEYGRPGVVVEDGQAITSARHGQLAVASTEAGAGIFKFRFVDAFGASPGLSGNHAADAVLTGTNLEVVKATRTRNIAAKKMEFQVTFRERETRKAAVSGNFIECTEEELQDNLARVRLIGSNLYFPDHTRRKLSRIAHDFGLAIHFNENEVVIDSNDPVVFYASFKLFVSVVSHSTSFSFTQVDEVIHEKLEAPVEEEKPEPETPVKKKSEPKAKTRAARAKPKAKPAEKKIDHYVAIRKYIETKGYTVCENSRATHILVGGDSGSVGPELERYILDNFSEGSRTAYCYGKNAPRSYLISIEAGVDPSTVIQIIRSGVDFERRSPSNKLRITAFRDNSAENELDPDIKPAAIDRTHVVNDEPEDGDDGRGFGRQDRFNRCTADRRRIRSKKRDARRTSAPSGPMTSLNTEFTKSSELEAILESAGMEIVMKDQAKFILSDIGARDMAKLVMEALVDAIQALKVDDSSCFCGEFKKLVEVVANTEPKFGVLNYSFSKLLDELEKNVGRKDINSARWKRIMVKRLKEILKKDKHNKRKLLKHAEDLDIEGKTILIHDHSHTVQDVLVHARNLGKHFRVVIAEQDFDKTHDNIERMHRARIPFQVVPSYMLSHVHDRIDMLFFGAVTLKDSMDFVMAPGTHSVISEFHVAEIPIYIFMDTAKFSLWKSKKRGEIFIHSQTRGHHSKPIEYERIKYSHDRVPANMFKQTITEKGVLGYKKLEKLFKENMKKYGEA